MPSAVSSTASRINCCDAGSELLTRSTCWPTPSVSNPSSFSVTALHRKCGRTPLSTARHWSFGISLYKQLHGTASQIDFLAYRPSIEGCLEIVSIHKLFPCPSARRWRKNEWNRFVIGIQKQ